MSRSNDPRVTAAMDELAPAAAVASRRQALTGSAVRVGSVGFEEAGVFDVGAGRVADDLVAPIAEPEKDA